MFKLKQKALMSIVAMIVVASVTACSNNSATLPSKPADNNLNSSGFPIVKEPITLKMVASKAPTHGEWSDMLVFQEYEKKTNVKVHWETIPQNAIEEKRNLKLASGDLPDAFYRTQGPQGPLTPFDEVNYGSQGVFIPLNGLIDKYAPNLKALFDKYPEIKKSITAPDGNIYSLPQVVDYLAPRINYKPWINKKWLDKVGLPVPTTTEEYYQALKAFKEKDPNGNGKSIPLAGVKTLPSWVALRGAFGLGNTGGRIDNFDLDANGKVRFYVTDSRYKELLEYLARLYKEGLIDKEVFTMEQAQFNAKASSGVVGSMHVSNSTLAGKFADDYVSLPALKGPHGDQLYSAVLPLTQVQGTFVITKNNKYPEATIRWVDYFYSEEGSKFFRMGIEGKTYETLPNGDIRYLESITKNPQGLTQDQAIGQFTAWGGGGLPHLITEKFDKTGNSSPSALASAKLLQPNIPKEIWPSFLFTKQEQERLNSLTSDIFTYVEEMRVKFITGAASFSEWDKYTDTIKKMGAEELTRIYQAAYDRWKKS